MSLFDGQVAPVTASVSTISQALRSGLTWPSNASLAAFKAASAGAACVSWHAGRTVCEGENPSVAWSLGLGPCARGTYLFTSDGLLGFVRLQISREVFASITARATAANAVGRPKMTTSRGLTSQTFTWYEGEYRLVASQSWMMQPHSDALTSRRLDVSKRLSTLQIAQGVGL